MAKAHANGRYFSFIEPYSFFGYGFWRNFAYTYGWYAFWRPRLEQETAIPRRAAV